MILGNEWDKKTPELRVNTAAASITITNSETPKFMKKDGAVGTVPLYHP
jgi:hypothetical protein